MPPLRIRGAPGCPGAVRGGLFQYQGALLPARFQGGNELQLFKRHQRYCCSSSRALGPSTREERIPTSILPREVQTVMGGKPAGEMALDEGRPCQVAGW